MANDAWQAWVEVLPDFSGFAKKANTGVTNTLGVAGTIGGRAFGSNFNDIFKGNLSSRVVGDIAYAAGRAIGDAIGAGVDYALGAIDLASSLNEQQNAVKVAFGASANDVLSLAKGSLENLFLSELSFDKIAVQFSNFSKTIAGEGGDVASVIDNITKRGADFASVYDLDVADALALFQSGLAGETEPLRRYGIDLSAASVAAFAYANGIAEQGKQLTEQQRIQAAYGALLQQTNIVQGDLANTSESYANQQRKLAESLQQAQTALGTSLLPTFTEFLNLANEELIPVLQEVIAEIGPELADGLKESAPAIVDLIRESAPLLLQMSRLGVEVLPVVVQLLRVLTPLLTDWAANTAATYTTLNALISLLSGDTTLEDFQKTIAGLSGSTAAFGAEIGHFISDVLQDWYDFGQSVTASIDKTASYITGLPDTIRSSVGNLGTTLYSAGADLINGLVKGVQSRAGEVAQAALKTVRDAVNGVRSFLGIHSPSTLAAEMGANYGQGWINGIVGKIPEAKAANLSLVAPPSVSAPSGGSTSAATRVVELGSETMRTLVDALKVEMFTDDSLLASSAGRGSGFQTALGAA